MVQVQGPMVLPGRAGLYNPDCFMGWALDRERSSDFNTS